MSIWSAEIKELTTLYESLKGKLPDLEKELNRLITADDENMVLLYSRRCLEVIVTDLCERELKRPRKTEPLKGVIDKLNKEEKVPSHIITSMQNLNSLSTYGAHPKEFDPEQVKPVLNNLTTIIKWYLKYKDTQIDSEPKIEEAKYESQRQVDSAVDTHKPKKRLIPILSGLLLACVIVIVVLVVFNVIGDRRQAEDLAILEKTIAVLPFDNMSYNEEHAYFGDAITDEIIMQLYKINEFIVRSRTSVMQYKATEKTSPVIGQELKVHYLIEGSAQRFEDQVRIRVQLIHAATDNHLWGETYEGNWKNILSVQSEIAKKIAGELKTVLTPDEIEKIEKELTDNPEAYDYYLRGNDYYWRSLDEHNWSIAINMYSKAIELDSNFALPYTRLALCYLNLFWFHYDRSQDPVIKSKKAIDAAFRIEPDLPEVYVALGVYYYYGFMNYSQALKYFKIALEQMPTNSELLYFIACVHRRMGNWEKAKEGFNKALENDPKSSRIANNAGDTYSLLSEYSEALHHFDQAIMLNPDFFLTYLQKIYLYLKRDGNTDLARETLKEASLIINSTLDPLFIYIHVILDIYDGYYQQALNYLTTTDYDVTESQLFYTTKILLYAWIYDLMNDTEKAYAFYDSARIELEARIIDLPDDSRFYSSLGIAYAGLGQKEKAIIAGKKAVEILPIGKDAWRGVYRAEDLAQIYVMVGEYESALKQLELLLSIPGNLSTQILQLDPIWKPLKDNPEFKRLLETYSED